jgi:hypothetical protein
VQQRTWTVAFQNAHAPTMVSINGTTATATNWTWDKSAHTLTVTAPKQSVNQKLVVSYK